MAGPNCELDWHFHYWNEEMARYAGEQLSNADTILLGRVTYCAMAKYWPSKTKDLLCPREDIAFADLINNCQKIVFSKTLENVSWSNSKLAKESIKTEITKLKQQPGKDMIVYGSGSIVSALSGSGLIDEYILWLHPVVLGKGKLLFKNTNTRPKLKLLNTRTFNTGVIILYYQLDRSIDSFKNSIKNIEIRN